ncbi:halocyanin domain-containing protein [Halobacteria archaeon AArc-m2/3/4]|uniref:Halocyanin domain-containing protein n=1 Tax=Natronoglomus mannanivorans TaxID=2979990 RepID=A0AAP2Z258_9EURY|nr:halocyanin domain-containing protein [Halobacteria archaeon AArc-xg1-1]MCU4973906.1 halocyanin domain-containing protein [Halobacteria archaeon AArc-m2/3/4]
MTTTDRSRRTFLKASGATLTLALVAGCLGGDDDDSSGNGGNGDGNGDDGNGDAGNGEEYDFDGWFDDVGYYDGVHDMTGESEVTVMNGTGSAGYEYDPAAIKVDPGTTVVWEWTGAGGGHTVTAEEGDFDSGMLTGEGETFEHTFDEEGVYTYYCEPHRNMGQKGAVVVE